MPSLTAHDASSMYRPVDIYRYTGGVTGLYTLHY